MGREEGGRERREGGREERGRERERERSERDRSLINMAAATKPRPRETLVSGKQYRNFPLGFGSVACTLLYAASRKLI